MSYTSMNNDINIGNDKISCLPDHILHHILSFLPTKQVVKTSLLSKSWRHLWRFVPSLDLESSLFNSRDDFVKFVETFLQLHKTESPIEKLCLKLGSRAYFLSMFGLFKITLWVNESLKFLQVLRLEFFPPPRYNVDLTQVFTSGSSLKVLELCRARVSIPTTTFSLPVLKIINVSRVTFKFEDEARLFCSSDCPALETLRIKYSVFTGLNKYKISLPQLKTLSLIDLKLDNSQMKIIIDTPKLLSLCLNNNYLNTITSFSENYRQNVTLFEAYINLPGFALKSMNDDIIQILNNAKSLGIAYPFLKSFLKEEEEKEVEEEEQMHILERRRIPVKLCNLKCLHLPSYLDDDDIKHLNIFIKLARKLETLIIRVCYKHPAVRGTKREELSFDGISYNATKRELGFDYTLPHIKSITLKFFEGYDNELMFLKFLLENAPALEKLILFTPRAKQSKDERNKMIGFREKLLVHPCASPIVEILFPSMN